MGAGRVTAPFLSPKPWPRRVTLAAVTQATARRFKVTPADLTAPDRPGAREPRFARPRQTAMYVARSSLRRFGRPVQLSAIGRYFGHRDHTTVIHAVRAVEKRMADDPETAEAVKAIIAELGL